MVVIKKLIIKSQYKYIWLKYVEGVDLSQHCARCLIGKYEKEILASKLEYDNLHLPNSKYYYLCAVYKYETNIHLAFIEKQGSKILIDNEYYHIEIENAEQIQIDKSSIDYTLPQSADKNFSTCRNWWFANLIK